MPTKKNLNKIAIIPTALTKAIEVDGIKRVPELIVGSNDSQSLRFGFKLIHSFKL